MVHRLSTPEHHTFQQHRRQVWATVKTIRVGELGEGCRTVASRIRIPGRHDPGRTTGGCMREMVRSCPLGTTLGAFGGVTVGFHNTRPAQGWNWAADALEALILSTTCLGQAAATFPGKFNPHTSRRKQGPMAPVSVRLGEKDLTTYGFVKARAARRRKVSSRWGSSP
jgi:hypothetical protein